MRVGTSVALSKRTPAAFHDNLPSLRKRFTSASAAAFARLAPGVRPAAACFRQRTTRTSPKAGCRSQVQPQAERIIVEDAWQ